LNAKAASKLRSCILRTGRLKRLELDSRRLEKVNSMKLFNLAALALALGVGSAAQAATISFESFTTAAWQDATQGGVVEDFENATDLNRTFAGPPDRTLNGNTYGELDQFGYVSQNVGIFQSAGGVGLGTTCTDLLDRGSAGCNQIALQYDPGINGQGNVYPETGQWSLNSADTLGIVWRASLPGGGLFQRIVFALNDPGDNNEDKLTITVGDTSKTWTSLEDGATWLAIIDLDAPTDLALIDIQTSLRDGFTLDGAGLSIAPIPLPASALLLRVLHT
jgi:hypothetical protein